MILSCLVGFDLRALRCVGAQLENTEGLGMRCMRGLLLSGLWESVLYALSRLMRWGGGDGEVGMAVERAWVLGIGICALVGRCCTWNYDGRLYLSCPSLLNLYHSYI